ncbi:hypothetical protein [Nocardioides xinjiangensis]|uniref:hypothetical protein n=1 Tax=Nocardioides xinjiangensis TaxID=2817376 RepID=UPI001B307749|nr:hypothetical protein [Nocardioides sp. SYSU D00514]
MALKTSSAIRSEVPELKAQMRRHTAELLPIAFIASLLMLMLGLFGLEAVLGPGWNEAAMVLAILSFGMFAQLAVSPQTVIFPLIRCEQLQLHLELAKTLLLFATTFLVGWTTQSLMWMTIVASVILFAGYLATIFVLLRRVDGWDASRLPREDRSH